MQVTPALVQRIVTRLFPPAQRAAAIGILGSYGSLAHEKEANRVRVDALKLANGSLTELAALIDRAKRDYRDILAWAEYPGEMRQPSWHLPASEQSEIREADRVQYLAWLKAHDEQG